MSNNADDSFDKNTQGWSPAYWGAPTPSQYPPVPTPPSSHPVVPATPSAACPDCDPNIDSLSERQQNRIRFLRWLRDRGNVGGPNDRDRGESQDVE